MSAQTPGNTHVAVPRLVVAGTASGVGKTTVSVGLIEALRARGLRVAAFKCGPDYLDPTYLQRASGHAVHNLDGWLMGRDAVVRTFVSAARGCDVAIVEGMMGLFDGASASSDDGSSAEIAKWLDAPVILVIDASAMARSAAALVDGFARFDPQLRFGGVVCNRVGGRGHLELLREALPEHRLVGGLVAEHTGSFPERHLGLVSARSDVIDDATFASWRDRVAAQIDLDAVLELARSAPDLPAPVSTAKASPVRCRIGVAADEAFHFYYPDNLALLEQAGASLVRFSPRHDKSLPDVDGLIFGGGYPETFASDLAANTSMLVSLRSFAAGGHPVYGECGGYMYLLDEIEVQGRRHRMAGLLQGSVKMTDRLQAIGYCVAETAVTSPLGPKGIRFRAHQFRYSHLDGQPAANAYRVTGSDGSAVYTGHACGSVLGSYLHVHFASNPELASYFVQRCVDVRRGAKSTLS